LTVAAGESFLDKIKKSPRVAIYWGKLALNKMPPPVQRRLVSRRHLRLVEQALVTYTLPAFLDPDPSNNVVTPTWMNPDNSCEPPKGGLDPLSFTEEDAQHARAWLAASDRDSDQELDERLDGLEDEIGRIETHLRNRLELFRQAATIQVTGNKILFDARCLQAAQYATRGIGRYAYVALDQIRKDFGDQRLVLLIDPALAELDAQTVGECEQIRRVTPERAIEFCAFFEPSPMTASLQPILPVLHSNAHKIAMVHDFIPLHYPEVYLTYHFTRGEYGSQIDALRTYDTFFTNSHYTSSQASKFLGIPDPEGTRFIVAWPENLVNFHQVNPNQETSRGPIVIITGDEHRKNTLGALAAAGLETANDPKRTIVVVGMSGHWVSIHHMSIRAAIREGETTTAPRLSEQELLELFQSASVVLVTSFDEGLSLPVIEAVQSGAPVVASDIPPHRELLGTGPFMAAPGDIQGLAAAITKTRGSKAIRKLQAAKVAAHQHLTVEQAVHNQLQEFQSLPAGPQSHIHVGGSDPKIALATPWPPQRSGVADFSQATALELAKLVDLTVFTTSGAQAQAADTKITFESIHKVLAGSNTDHFNHFINVLGNSSFHLPFFKALDFTDSVVISHDTRFVEYYAAYSGGGVEQLMVKTKDPNGRTVIYPPFYQQIDDLRLLQNAGYWAVAHKVKQLFLHTPMAKERIFKETGLDPVILPFAVYHAPETDQITNGMRESARRNLGFDQHPADTIHLASFGFIDTRTKMADVLVEAAAWLTQWGHTVSLHLVGSAQPEVQASLVERARHTGIFDFKITGYTSESEYRDYILAIDLGVQLRISPLLGVAGPLSDMAAHGTPALGSRGVCVDVDTPAFIDRLPDDVSAIMVAQAIEHRIAHPHNPEDIESQRRKYLAEKSPAQYAQQLLQHLTDGTNVRVNT
jgi:glycosyltransferase involved in cell wall biosynthesis